MGSIRRFSYLVEIITLLGVILYVSRSFYFANSSLSIGDEGAYLYKGYMFARGDYEPFQDYGFWTNKAPLAFLIPGYVQLWFGPGLREGRYFAIALSVFTLAGIWIVSNRLSGRAGAAVAVWVFALSDAYISTYSLVLSQGLVAFLMSWMFVCILGDKRPPWQLVLGALLSVLVVMTRQNMIVVPPLVVLFIFWQNGWKSGFWALIASVVLFIGFHVYYWPNILQLWAAWLPESATPFFNGFRSFAASDTESWKIGFPTRLYSFSIGVRDHFFVLCGFVGGSILFPRRADWKSDGQYKAAIFLALVFISLSLMHAWASLFNDFCVQCFSSYQLFYSMSGVFFIVLVGSNKIFGSLIRNILLVICGVFFMTSLGLYYFQFWGAWLLENLQLPRISKLIRAGEIALVPLREVLTYVFDLPAKIQTQVASALGGALIGVIIILVAWTGHRLFLEKKRNSRYTFAGTTLSCLLVLGVVVPPILGRGAYSPACGTNFLDYYEATGRSLSEIVPAGSLVYWKGSGRHLALMLYLDDVRIFPPQITAGGGIMLDGDTDQLLKFGLFSDSIDKEWRNTADRFIIWKDFPTLEFKDFQDQTKYQILPFDMGGLADCEDPLYLFTRFP